MRLTTDTNHGAYAVSVPCIRCGKMKLLADTIIDIDGPAFRAYYCKEHPPVNSADAATVYANR